MSFQTCTFFIPLNTKEDILKKQLAVAIDFYSMEKKNIMEVNGYRQLFGYQHYI